MEEEVCTTTFDTKVARLKWKLILQDKGLARSKHNSAHRTHIIKENIGFAFLHWYPTLVFVVFISGVLLL